MIKSKVSQEKVWVGIGEGYEISVDSRQFALRYKCRLRYFTSLSSLLDVVAEDEKRVAITNSKGAPKCLVPELLESEKRFKVILESLAENAEKVLGEVGRLYAIKP